MFEASSGVSLWQCLKANAVLFSLKESLEVMEQTGIVEVGFGIVDVQQFEKEAAT